MDFLESASILVPTLTGLAITIYRGEQDVLSQFEHKYCFSPRIQRIYTALGMNAFCSTGSEELIYELAEPMGSHLIAAKAGVDWILLGPFVTDEWNEQLSRSHLIKLGLSENAVLPYKSYRCKLPIIQQDLSLKIVLSIVGQVDGGTVERQVKTIFMDADHKNGGLDFSGAYEDASITNKRYSLEYALIQAISKGEIEKVYEIMTSLHQVTSNLKFISNNLTDQIAGASALRSDVRIAAMLAGLSPVLIDSISQEYAQKIRRAISAKEVTALMMHLIERICAEVRKMRSSNYSMAVRKAMDYMEINLSNPMDSAEIAKVVGMDRRLLVRTFSLETGMTIKQYLAKIRCEIAAGLLRSSHFSIQAIAAYVGYTDNNYFTKVFKANQGISPRDYRKAHWPSE